MGLKRAFAKGRIYQSNTSGRPALPWTTHVAHHALAATPEEFAEELREEYADLGTPTFSGATARSLGVYFLHRACNVPRFDLAVLLNVCSERINQLVRKGEEHAVAYWPELAQFPLSHTQLHREAD